MMAAVGVGTRSGMLMTTTGRVGDVYEEVRRGRKTVELNRNQTPDQGQAQYLDRVLVDLPPIILPNPHRCLVR